MALQNDDARIFDMATKREATVEDLYRFSGDGKAELVDGDLVVMSPTGDAHGHAVVQIVVSLHEYGRRTKSGRAIADSVGFLVRLPRRRSFSPDAAFYTGPPFGAKFIEGAPVFAVEVRSEEDYGPAAERAMAAKRADYFAAGTLVVWDVDVLRKECVRVYRAADPQNPTIYRRGETAEAEPAVPEWTFAVDDLFLPPISETQPSS
jgi:Uma2 family endonuclease